MDCSFVEWRFSVVSWSGVLWSGGLGSGVEV